MFPLDSYQTQIISGNLQKLHYLDLNLNYPKGTIYRNGPVKEHGTPTKLYINSLKNRKIMTFLILVSIYLVLDKFIMRSIRKIKMVLFKN